MRLYADWPVYFRSTGEPLCQATGSVQYCGANDVSAMRSTPSTAVASTLPQSQPAARRRSETVRRTRDKRFQTFKEIFLIFLHIQN